MSSPETDAELRARLMRVVSEKDRTALSVVSGRSLDAIALRYDRFRTGVALRAFERLRDDREPTPFDPLCHDDGYLA